MIFLNTIFKVKSRLLYMASGFFCKHKKRIFYLRVVRRVVVFFFATDLALVVRAGRDFLAFAGSIVTTSVTTAAAVTPDEATNDSGLAKSRPYKLTAMTAPTTGPST
jgi:hypothetical protein